MFRGYYHIILKKLDPDDSSCVHSGHCCEAAEVAMNAIQSMYDFALFYLDQSDVISIHTCVYMYTFTHTYRH